MGLPPEARTILFILNNFAKNKTPTPKEAISTHPLWSQQGSTTHLLTNALDHLIERGHIVFTRDGYSLTDPGLALLKQFMSDGFSSLLMAAEQSPTSRRFCQQVYGHDLCQFNSMSMAQFNKLLAVMDLGVDDHILDLGCGVGLISEYIADVTGASMVGIDFAAGAISRAKERTYEKRDRLAYQVMDLDELRLSGQSFSGMIAIDALHFANDLTRVIRTAQASLQENGQMGIFYAPYRSPGDPRDILAPDQTPLAMALQECRLEFRTWDFTQDEAKLWEQILQVAEELKQAYEAEGNRWLYDTTVSDAQPMFEAIISGRRRRYLYHVQ